MSSSLLTLLLHCCAIVGKESDKIWEDEQITKKENKGEQKDTKQYHKKQKRKQRQEVIRQLIEF